MVFLKAVSEFSLIAIVAGAFTARFGASVTGIMISFAAAVISVFLSFFLRDKKVLRFVPVLLVFASALYPDRSIAWIIVTVLFLAFAIFTIAGKHYIDVDEHQKSILKAQLALTGVMLVLTLLFQLGDNALAVIITSAFAGLCATILYLRSVRHEPEVYNQASFQLVNAGLIAAAAAVVVVLSNETILNGFFSGLRAAYTWIATKIVDGLLFVIQCIEAFFRWLSSLLSFGHVQKAQEQQAAQIQMQGNEDLFGDISEITGPPLWLRIVFWVFVAAIVVLIIWVIFRAIAGRRMEEMDGKASSFKSYAVKGAGREKERSKDQDVQGVRKQYKKYLQYMTGQGLQLSRSNTSQEIEVMTGSLSRENGAGDEEKVRKASDELRQLYLKARYNNAAEKSDAERAKYLVGQIKKSF